MLTISVMVARAFSSTLCSDAFPALAPGVLLTFVTEMPSSVNAFSANSDLWPNNLLPPSADAAVSLSTSAT
jgi:hypothetical protein